MVQQIVLVLYDIFRLFFKDPLVKFISRTNNALRLLHAKGGKREIKHTQVETLAVTYISTVIPMWMEVNVWNILVNIKVNKLQKGEHIAKKHIQSSR